jgi:hypothetical protein
MSPRDAGKVTDTATSLAQLATSLARFSTPPPDEDDVSVLEESPPRKADIRLFNDPSNFLG